MFKKLKDKLAEEVKSSPQRIQQFAQAAQAAVTSASSSISDITNSDLFSIGDNDSQPNHPAKAQTSRQQNTFQDVPLVQATGVQKSSHDFSSSHDITDNQRQRRLSNSSFASDVSFRLPSYESPSMYHLQSDMEISASEAEERGFSSSAISLDRVTKEQLYAAYKRTQDRYTKYRTQYANLAHHYKLLERENAKARSVLVETQDKALRRISELREQCALEQSAKAHLEKALQVDIEEKNMKIEALNTKISLLQNNVCDDDETDNQNKNYIGNENVAQLITLAADNEVKLSNEEATSAEITSLNNKLEKLEQLVNKYKESLKTTKEKNAQMTTELQKLTNELENKNKECELLKTTTEQLFEAKNRIQELEANSEELQNKINSYDFSKTKEISTLEIDLQKAKEEIVELQSKIDIFSKREEEYAISLAENKLSIHKELESKEAEIKSLKEGLTAAKKELQSVDIIVNDYKNKLSLLEEERGKLTNDISELNITKNKVFNLEEQIQLLTQKSQTLEHSKSKADEQYKCLQLQMKQETAEKLAMIDRNIYLENRISHLTEENTKKSTHISKLENDLKIMKQDIEEKNSKLNDSKENESEAELNIWKTKYSNLELEIQEERDELVKLQSEIEKLLTNHELIQTQNTNLNAAVLKLKSENDLMREKLTTKNNMKLTILKIARDAKDLRKSINISSEEVKLFKKEFNNINIPEIQKCVNSIKEFSKSHEVTQIKYQKLQTEYEVLQERLKEISKEQEVTLKALEQFRAENEINSKEILSKQESLTKELQYAHEEKQNLIAQLQEYEKLQNDYSILRKEFNEITEKLESTSNHLIVLKEENGNNKSILQEYNNLKKNNEATEKYKRNILDKLKISTEELDHKQKENDVLRLQLQRTQSELEDVKILQKDCEKRLMESEESINKMRQECEDKEVYNLKLKQTIESVSQENMSLKNQSENITKNVKSLESEIDEVRKTHANMETEKDRLNEIIEQLEKNQRKTLIETSDKNIETDLVPENESIKSLTAKTADLEIEIVNLKDMNTQLSNKLLKQEINISEDISVENTEKYLTLSNECELLKEENRRLQSDVEGLQTYLTKISKENGVLNDRLRELIASSENSPDKNELQLCDTTDLKNEVQLGKQRIDDLLRENSLLLEEILELKDQISSQNYIPPETSNASQNGQSMEFTSLREKYNQLLAKNKNLEERLIDLEHINKSVNENMQHMQNGDQKLRLANEKLERRLDEALVSLRHLHALQENTELEYLRNILYEYLTGSGTHSITLAKVLSAVVKFDDRQTQIVLQKEKERQGLLRQLGLI